MPADEYKSFGSGALKLKGVSGSKVKKSKKKKQQSDLEKNLSTGEAASTSSSLVKAEDRTEEGKQLRRSPSGAEDGDSGGDAAPTAVRQFKTEAERRFEEARRKKVSPFLDLDPGMRVCEVVKLTVR